MSENTLVEKINMLAGSITSHFSGSGPLSSDIKVIYDELDNSEDDVKDAVTSLQSSGVKSLFIRAVFFDKRCSLNSVIKDIPDFLIEGYLESVTNIYGEYHSKDYKEESMSNSELAEKAADLVEHGLNSMDA
ncbi:MAG: hypothetical protein ACI4CX_01815 [Candidatus Weimeria sp.]